jgi:hypothetical protein
VRTGDGRGVLGGDLDRILRPTDRRAEFTRRESFSSGVINPKGKDLLCSQRSLWAVVAEGTSKGINTQ